MARNQSAEDIDMSHYNQVWTTAQCWADLPKSRLPHVCTMELEPPVSTILVATPHISSHHLVQHVNASCSTTYRIMRSFAYLYKVTICHELKPADALKSGSLNYYCISHTPPEFSINLFFGWSVLSFIRVHLLSKLQDLVRGKSAWIRKNLASSAKKNGHLVRCFSEKDYWLDFFLPLMPEDMRRISTILRLSSNRMNAMPTFSRMASEHILWPLPISYLRIRAKSALCITK